MNIAIGPVVSKVCKLGLSVLLISSLVGCVQQNYVPTKTSIELQSIQTRDFDTTKEVAFASTVSTFQDMGYTIVSAELGSGFVTANGPAKSGFIPFVGQTMETLNATAFVESMGQDKAKVRLNFVNQQRTSSGYGMQGGNDLPVEDPAFYQNAFEKIAKAIFVRKSY